MLGRPTFGFLLILLSLPFCNPSTRVRDNKPGSDGIPPGDMEDEKAELAASSSAPQRPEPGKENEETFKKAVELARSGKPKKALELFSGLEGKMGPLEDYRLYFEAECLLELEQPEEVLNLLATLDGMKDSRLRGEAASMRAEAFFLQESYERAAAEYKKIVEKDKNGDPGPLFMLARSYEESERPLKARNTYARIIRKLPYTQEARAALEAYEKLSPGFTLPDKWRRDRVEALEEQRRFSEALEELEKLKVPTSLEAKHQHFYKKASLMYKARTSYKDALKILAKLIAQKSKLSERALLLSAKCKRRMGDIKGARLMYQMYLKRYPGSKAKGEVLLVLLKLDLQEGRWNFITRHWAAFAGRKSLLSGSQRRYLQWVLGYANLLTGDPHKAGNIFASMKKGTKDRTEIMRSDYWHAVTLQIRGKKKRAAAAFNKLFRENPFHYYSVLSLIRLREMNQDIDIPPPPGEDAGAPARDEDPCALLPEKAGMLTGMGLEDEARAEMESKKDWILDQYASDPDKLLTIFKCGRAQDVLYQSVSGKYQKYTSYFPYKDIVSYWKILYPTYRMDDVRKISAHCGVSEYLTLSIIRQESRFDAEATSYAGAMGLMQLMPKTARHIAGKLGEDFDREEAYDPDTNMRYGVYYIASLVDKFHGNIALAAAGYNGGPHNVGRWLKHKWTDRLDLFVELIPFAQTRNYVRRVTTSYARYHYLYEGTIEPVVNALSLKPTPQFKKGPSF